MSEQRAVGLDGDNDSKDTSSAPAPATTSGQAAKAGPKSKGRPTSSDNKRVARRFFSAYAQTWIGLSPIWLMGEALTPGKKIGSKFKHGSSQLRAAADEVRSALSTSSQDIIVIVDEKLGQRKSETSRAAEVVKAAGYEI
jgi:hypothetical protein